MENQNQSPTNTGSSADFTPPRHWIGAEELEASYWQDAKIQERRGQEFYDKPVEVIDQIDRMDKKGLARRDFLTVMGASMAMASFSCARRPVHKIIPYVVKPEEIVPGVANWYASTCADCGCRCGVLIKTREGRPIKLEGNPDHPLNQGALCSKGQASILNLYDPDRLKNPILKGRQDKSRKDLSWAQADELVQGKLKASSKVRLLTGAVKSPSQRRLFNEFLGKFSNAKWVEFEPLHLEELPESQALSYGTNCVPQYHFEKAELILTLGADFLENWLSPVEHSKGWSKGRKLADQKAAQAKLSKLICFESILSVTGANADVRHQVLPSALVDVALALAHELIVRRKVSHLASDPSLTAALKDYSVEAVSGWIGLANGANILRDLASELLASRGKSLVVGGGVETRTEYSLALQVAINLLNSALDNEGVTVDGTSRATESLVKIQSVLDLLAELKSGQVDFLLVHKTNPAYSLSNAQLGLSEAFKQAKFLLVSSDREDETAKLADLVLPDHHYLENWGDASVSKGLFSIQQPAIAPIHDTRAFEDSLLKWGNGPGLKTGGLMSQSEDWHGYLKANWKETVFPKVGAIAGFESFWEGTLRSGVIHLKSDSDKPAVRAFRSAALGQSLKGLRPANSEGLTLVLYSKTSMGDGRFANNAWLQELPDPISTVTWDNYLNLSPSLAKELHFKDDEVVELSVGDVSVHIPVHIQPGLHPRVVSAAIGYGRRAVGKVGNLAGVDVFPFVRASATGLVFAGHKVQLKKTGKFYKLAATQWHGQTESRPIINDITLAQFRKNPAATGHIDPELRMEKVPSLWPVHEYKGYRWGMAIDLNACTGCGACMVACQAENNIPVVGRDNVRVSRQMHWIRIDRYYSGTSENPEVVFQPMLCQHCENASCETVCPVLATVHDDEGLNVQVYNRCVGTRYCQNNCPYKVRRFNFFDHWKAYEGPMNMAWNPDVTVRTRGIMEKCTFCTQRIREAKEAAKDSGDRVKDGDFQVACQQTCATDAIVFGDLNDPNSRVSQMKESPQAFRVLEILNNKPSISYLTKVRNRPEGAHSSEHHV